MNTPYCLLTSLVVCVALLVLPTPSQAFQRDEPPLEEITWAEQETDYFVIVYATEIVAVNRYAPFRADLSSDLIPCDLCGPEEAERYAEFIDGLYDELATVFDTDLPQPVTLRLFPTEQSYFTVNLIAEYLTGVIAHALNSRSEVAVALPRTQTLDELQIVNNMRHEFTHLFASVLSDGKLSAGFQEGIAQYVEQPSDRSSYNAAILAQAVDQNRLLTWDELDEAQQVYTDPQVAYPQSLSIVAFLIDRYGFPTFLEFLQALADEAGYRSAMDAVYGKSAETLEEEWQTYLPLYLSERWQINVLHNYDLSRVNRLVEEGAFSDAEVELTTIADLLETTNQPETLTEVLTLLKRTEQGQIAGQTADEARQAIEAGNYPLTIATANTALEQYAAVGYKVREQELRTYVYRAELGLSALEQLERGRDLFNRYQLWQAEPEIYAATELLQALDNPTEARKGILLLQQIADRQRWIVYVIVVVGLALLAINAGQRVIKRFTAAVWQLEFR